MIRRGIKNVILATHFDRQLKNLSFELQEETKSAIDAFIINPFDHSLNTHKLHNFQDCWAFSVNKKIRIIFKFLKNDVAFFYDIGSHQLYKKR